VVEERLAQIWADVLGGQGFGVLEDFFALGGHSLLAIRVIAQIEKHFGQTLSLTDFYSRPTIDYLATILNKGLDDTLSSRLVPLQTRGTERPVFFVHPSGGSVHWYIELARHIGTDRPFYGIQARGLRGRTDIATTIDEMATEYVAALRTVQPNGPYLLGSWSFGVIVVYEMAQQLRAAGEEIALLAILDQGPHIPHAEPDDEAEYLVQLFQEQLDLDVEYLRTLPAEEQTAHVFMVARGADWLLPDVTFLQFRHFLRIMRTQSAAWRCYQPTPYRGHITLFRAEKQSGEVTTPDMGWQDLALGGVTIVDIPGDHLTMLREPLVGTLAQKLKTFLPEPQLLGAQSAG
jgi:thioesterase domain-containing protein/acyl carrier protein